MNFLAVLPLGVLLGMAHAMEADHLAAVTAMRKNSDGHRALLLRGMVWGLGHTLTLFVTCIGVFLLGLTISGRVESGLELGVGIMIVGLGVHVLWRLHRDRVHVHVHSHGDTRHLHMHCHAQDTAPHKQSGHDHRHISRAAAAKVMAIGVMHGLAGSASFLILLTASADSIWQALAYVGCFGLGTMIGMAALTAVIGLPLGLVQRIGGWAPAATSVAIGCMAILVGTSHAVDSLRALYTMGG